MSGRQIVDEFLKSLAKDSSLDKDTLKEIVVLYSKNDLTAPKLKKSLEKLREEKVEDDTP